MNLASHNASTANTGMILQLPPCPLIRSQGLSEHSCVLFVMSLPGRLLLRWGITGTDRVAFEYSQTWHESYDPQKLWNTAAASTF